MFEPARSDVSQRRARCEVQATPRREVNLQAQRFLTALVTDIL